MNRSDPTEAQEAGPLSYPDPSLAPGSRDSGDAGSAPDMLLKAPNPIELCLSCHDERSDTPDVVESDINKLAERSAGHFSSPYRGNPRGHNLGQGSADADEICDRCHGEKQGERWVTCLDCHAHHGNNNPRNLKWAVHPEETPPLGLFNPPGIEGLRKYERTHVAYGTLNSPDLRELSSLCLGCHHSLGGSSPHLAGRGHTTHPSYDSERGALNSIAQGAARGATDPAHWTRGEGSGFVGAARVPFVVPGARNYASASVVEPSTNAVFCLTCHKAHGSSSAFGLTWKLDGAVGRRGCDQCHAIKPLPSREGPQLASSAQADDRP